MKKNTLNSYYKIVFPICIVTIISLLIITMVTSFIKIDHISKQMIFANQQSSINKSLLRTMSESSLNRSILLLEMIQTNDDIKREGIHNEVHRLANEFLNAKTELQTRHLSEGQKFLFSRQNYISKRSLPVEHEVHELLLKGKFEQAKYVFFNSSSDNRYKSVKTLKEISNLQDQIGKDDFDKLKQKSNDTLKKILISVIVTVLICIILTVFLVIFQRSTEEKLTKLVNSDALTGLPNRVSLINSVENTLDRNPERIFALVFLDIDYFKSINDNYGHDVGDEILRQFSSRITESISYFDKLARFGGDEFVLLLRSITSKKEAMSVIRSISKLLDTSFIIDNREIFTTSSIGATIYTVDSDCNDAKMLLSQADNAMYLAKKSGRNCYYLFSKDTHIKMQKEHVLSHNLQTVLKNNNKDHQLYMNYQPLYNLKNLKVTGFEALIRWDNEAGTSISPDEFIPVAEKTNLIEKINMLVIKEVCEQKSKWNDQKKNIDLRINFNLSGNKNSFDYLLDNFKHLVALHNLKYSDFGIELTERTILEVEKDTADQMKQLKRQGLKILIDDFGTGYSSLSYLKKLPITTIKIDKSFISGLPKNKDDKELVKTIITLGKSFKLDIIAEGVETKEQLKFLQDHSCLLAQGYYFNKPLHINEINNFEQSDYTKVA